MLATADAPASWIEEWSRLLDPEAHDGSDVVLGEDRVARVLGPGRYVRDRSRVRRLEEDHLARSELLDRLGQLDDRHGAQQALAGERPVARLGVSRVTRRDQGTREPHVPGKGAGASSQSPIAV